MPVTCDLVLDCRAIVRMTLGFVDDRFPHQRRNTPRKKHIYVDTDLADAIFR
jgi:hypothetical protein